jgi:catechol 2,3-dioxygenase
VYEKLISQLAHVELITPDLEGSARFFVDVLGLDECGREGDTIYLRCWSDYFRHSVELTAGPQPALGHIAWRAQGPDQLRDAVARIDAAGLGEGWRESGFGHGRAYRYCGPGGHVQEIFWDVERYAASPEMRSPFPNRPQRLIARGVACRQLDHVTVVTPKPYEDAEWYRDNLNYRFTEYTVAAGRDDLCVFATVTNNEKSHDLGLVIDPTGARGRLHHLAFWVDESSEVARAADILINSGTEIETGPGRHGIGEQPYLYFREPGGLRIEINSGGYRIYEPDWPTVRWTPAQGSNVFYRNLPNSPASMRDAFPPVDAPPPSDPALVSPFSLSSVR